MNSDSLDTPNLVILGGGLAGLALARELLQNNNCNVTVLEKAPQPGGLAISLNIQGIKTDLGPHRIHTNIPEMRTWFHDLLGESMISVERSSQMFVDCHYMKYPPSPIEMLLRFGPVQMADFAIGLLTAKLRTSMGCLPRRSFAIAMERSFGRPMCEKMVYPYIRKMWKCEASQISIDAARVRATMGGVRAMIRRLIGPEEKEGKESTLKRFGYVRGGIGQLVDKLRSDVEKEGGRIICNAEVTRLTVDGHRVQSVEYDSEGENKSIPCDFTFGSIPLTDIVNLLSQGKFGHVQAEEAARQLKYLNTILAFATLQRPRLTPNHWLYFPQATPDINRVYEPLNFDKSLGEEGKTLVCIEGTAYSGDKTWNSPDNELKAHLIEQFASTGLFHPEEVLSSHLHRVENTYPVYSLDYYRHLAIIWHSLQTLKNFIPLGRQGLFQHNNMDHTIFTALRAAACWREQTHPVTSWYREEMSVFRDFRIVD